MRDLISGLKSLGPGRSGDLLVERRNQVRLQCYYPVAVECAGKRFRSIVTDIGPQGMRLKFVEPLSVGATVHVTYPELPAPDTSTVSGRVVWCRKRGHSSDLLAGLSFGEPGPSGWVARLLGELGLPDGPRATRREWLRAASEIPAALDGERAVVLDLGMGGARLQVNADTEARHLVLGPWWGFPALELPCRSASRRHDSDVGSVIHGLSFDPLTAPQVRGLGRYVLRLLRESVL